MKRIAFWSLIGVTAAALLVNYSCSKSNGQASTTPPKIGKDSVLVNLGNNIILPSFRSMAAAANALDSAILDFNTLPTPDKLSSVQALFKTAYLDWEAVSAFDGFGPAYSSQPLLSGLNLFPTNSDRIDSNIVSGNTNVNTLANNAAKGFPALDYLLFGSGANVLADYTTDGQAAHRKQYLAAVSADIKGGVNAAYTAWSPTGGNYVDNFINGKGNSISSSLGLLLNSMVQDFEVTKNDRLGIPLGKQPPGQVLPVLPKEVEGYYSGISAQLALAQLRSVQGIYLGSSVQSGGPGLQQYLVNVKAAYHGGSMADTIRITLEQAVAQAQSIPDPFSATIQANPGPADILYTQTQQLVVFFKTDMPSSLGVLITYGDNDGD